MSIWRQLKERKVVNTAIVYLIFAWVAVQVAVTVEEPLGLPGWSDTLVIVLLVAGFPLALILSWVFDFRPANPATTGRPVEPVIVKSIGITIGVLVTLVVILAAHRMQTGSWIFAEPEFDARLSNQRLVSDFPGSHSDPSPSPDGSMISFVSDTTGVPQIWVQSLSGSEPVQVTGGDVPSLAPAWSPSDQRIFFHRPGEGIWVVNALGSREPRQILEHGENASLAVDRQLLVFERSKSILAADPEGGSVREVGGVPERFFTNVRTSPAVSPDGNWIAFFLQHEGPNGDIWVIPASGGEARRLTFDELPASAPAWTPDGRFILFSSRRGGSQTVWSVPFDGGTPYPVTTGSGEDSTPAISADGRHLFYGNARVEYRLTESDPDTGHDTVLLESRQSIIVPAVSPDGRTIAFFSEVYGGVHVFTVGRHGNDLRQLTHGQGEVNIHPRFSSDGSEILFYQLRPDRGLRAVPAGGGPSREVLPDFTWQTHMGVTEDPAGERIAFLRMEPPDWSKDRNLVVDLETGDQTQFADPHMHSLQWSRDGTLLIGWRHDGSIGVCPVDGEECTTIGNDEPLMGAQPLWSSDGTRLYIRRDAPQPDHREVWAANREGRDARKLLTYGPVQGLNATFALTPDNTVIWVQYVRSDNEIWMADFSW